MSLCTVKKLPAVPRFRTRTHSRSAALWEMQDRTLAVWPPERAAAGRFGRPPRFVTSGGGQIADTTRNAVTVPAIAIVAVPVVTVAIPAISIVGSMVVAVSRHHRGRMAICFCTSLIRLPWSSCQREKHRNVCRRARPPKLERVAFCVAWSRRDWM